MNSGKKNRGKVLGGLLGVALALALAHSGNAQPAPQRAGNAPSARGA